MIWALYGLDHVYNPTLSFKLFIYFLKLHSPLNLILHKQMNFSIWENFPVFNGFSKDVGNS